MSHNIAAYEDELLALARTSIHYGLSHARAPSVSLDDCAPALRQPGAAFITLTIDGQLRGCIGSLEARRPLAEDIAQNAYAAAFNDPRFTPLSSSEFNDLDIHISVLSPQEPMAFSSEKDLIEQLRPGVDGLVLEEGRNRGTFLPSVWESLPNSALFLRQLKRKAGLPEDYWSETIKIYRYTTTYLPSHEQSPD